jgi:hypothetical protein
MTVDMARCPSISARCPGGTLDEPFCEPSLEVATPVDGHHLPPGERPADLR